MLKSRRILENRDKFLPNGSDVSVDAIGVEFNTALRNLQHDALHASAHVRTVLDVLTYFVQGDMDLNQTVELIKEADFKNNTKSASVFVDTLWLLGTQLAPVDETNAASADDVRSGYWSKLCALVKRISDDDLIDINTLKLSLEFNLLCAAGILKDEAALRSKLVKCNTQLMYRQQKYNLLREESEGYSKLLTILNAVPAPPLDPSANIKHLTSVIGYFDLDPNRVMDVVLDVFEQQLWNLSFINVLQIFRKSNIVHLLGFKFSRYHTSSQSVKSVTPAARTTSSIGGTSAKDSSRAAAASGPSGVAVTAPEEHVPPTPKSLYLLAVVLMSFDLVRLDELLPYLGPSVSETTAACTAEVSKITAELKAFGVMNLSAKVSELPTLEATSSTVVKAKSFAGGNQFFGLIAAAYELRQLDIASRVQSVLQAAGCSLISSFCDEVREALTSLILWRTELIYHPIGFIRLGLSQSTASRELNQPSAGSLPELPGQCSQLADLSAFISEIGPMLYTLSHHLGSSPVLFTRICRLMDSLASSPSFADSGAMDIDHPKEPFKTKDPSYPVEYVNLIGDVMLPSLSRSKSIASYCAQLVWSLIVRFPFQERFALYQRWHGCGLGKDGLKSANGFPAKDVLVCFAETKVLHYAKAQLKRLTKDNVKQMGRSISIATHSCPLISYTHILNQIQVFDNLIPFVVDTLKFTTDLSRDVMAYALVSQLQKDSEKLKKGDTHYSQWFASLSKFVATFYRKYPATCLDGLLHFLVSSLSKGESLDLLVLRELLSKMGGCETMLDLSHSQLDGLSGGKALQQETMGGQVKEGASKKAIRLLRDELTKTQTAYPLLYLISRIRSTIIFGIDTTHLKLVSHMYDLCQDVLMQFTEFLVVGGLSGSTVADRNKNMESIADSIPSLQQLTQFGGLSLAVAFQLIRPLVRLALQSSLPASMMAAIQSDKTPAAIKNAAVACSDLSNCPAHLRQWHPLSPDILNAIAQAAPADGGWPDTVSLEFYSLFWALSTYDLKMPKARYELEIRRLRDRCQELDGTGKPSADDIDKTKQQKAAELKRLNTVLKSLQDEMAVQKIHVDITSQLMKLKKESFFLAPSGPEGEKIRHAMNETFVQHCVLPRVFLSPIDAVYCSQFFYLLNTIDTPNYNMLSFLDKFMKLITPLIFSSTEYEASFLGHAVNDILFMVNRWAGNPSVYARETQEKDGTYQKFNTIYGIWNLKLKNTIIHGLKSKEYMYIRSSLVLLSNIAQNFPSGRKIGNVILETVEGLEKEETGRSDLALMAKSLSTILKKRSSMWIDDVVKKPVIAPGLSSAIAVASETQPPSATAAAGKKGAATKVPDATAQSATAPRGGKASDASAQENGGVTSSIGINKNNSTDKNDAKDRDNAKERDHKEEKDRKGKDTDKESKDRSSNHRGVGGGGSKSQLAAAGAPEQEAATQEKKSSKSVKRERDADHKDVKEGGQSNGRMGHSTSDGPHSSKDRDRDRRGNSRDNRGDIGQSAVTAEVATGDNSRKPATSRLGNPPAVGGNNDGLGQQGAPPRRENSRDDGGSAIKRARR